jgi:two-component system cell cycle response regulator
MASARSSNRPKKPVATVRAGPEVASEVMHRVKAQYRPVLVVLSGNEVGQRLLVDRSLLLGRDPDADLVLSDVLVSWHHATIEDRGDSWTLVDLNSTNGTSVNGQRVLEAALKPDDRVVLGNTVISFELLDHVAQAYGDLVERLLNIDDLSGLFVRRKFDTELGILWQTALQKRHSLGLLVMDLDGIKQINDTHGHLFGAYVIGECGRVIGDVIGGRGIATRFGGDEFIAALPKLDAGAAAEVAEEVLTAIAEHHFEREGIALHPGISIGVAAYPEDADSTDSLFQRADEAMYRAKQAGKRRICR